MTLNVWVTEGCYRHSKERVYFVHDHILGHAFVYSHKVYLWAGHVLPAVSLTETCARGVNFALSLHCPGYCVTVLSNEISAGLRSVLMLWLGRAD